MQSIRTLKTITRNMISLYKTGKYADLLMYRRAIERDLCHADYCAVRQAFNHKITNRI